MKKRGKAGLADLKFQRGWSGGWSEYRYGPAKPITLPNSNGSRIFRGRKRDHCVKTAMDALRDWRLSPFEHEGAVVAGMRSGLCGEGYGWPQSDAEVRAIVDDALRILGAVRPTWEQGQREYVEPRENCRQCGGQLDEYRSRAMFCSPECARIFLNSKSYESKATDDIRYQHAQAMMRRERGKQRTCQNCGTTFRVYSDNPGRFCSKPCMYAFRGAGEAAVHEKDCAWCGARFTAKTAAARFCRPLCQLQESRIRTGNLIPKKISPPVFDYVFRWRLKDFEDGPRRRSPKVLRTGLSLGK